MEFLCFFFLFLLKVVTFLDCVLINFVSLEFLSLCVDASLILVLVSFLDCVLILVLVFLRFLFPGFL